MEELDLVEDFAVEELDLEAMEFLAVEERGRQGAEARARGREIHREGSGAGTAGGQRRTPREGRRELEHGQGGR
jgi:hypothetical protein